MELPKNQPIKETPNNKLSVMAICYKYPGMKKYMLWALKLMEDMPHLFKRVHFHSQLGKPSRREQKEARGTFDIYLVDDLESHRSAWVQDKLAPDAWS